MAVAALIREEAARKGITGRQLAKRACYDPAAISRLLTGQRPAINPLTETVARYVGSAKVWLQLAYEATNGIFTTPWPDGPVANIDPAATYLKAVQEDKEDDGAKERLADLLTRQPASISDDEKTEAHRLLLQVVDELRADAILIAAVCDALGIDVVRLFRDHDQKLAVNGTIATARRAA